VNPDAWLWKVNGQKFMRRVSANGTVVVDKRDYYVDEKLAKHYVILEVAAVSRNFLVYEKSKNSAVVLKTLPIKGLYNREMDFAEYVAVMEAEALSDYRRRQG
jgi:hypothetical protein